MKELIKTDSDPRNKIVALFKENDLFFVVYDFEIKTEPTDYETAIKEFERQVNG